VVTTPNYAKIKIPNNSVASKYTCTKIHALEIKDEIRFQYVKKQNSNQKFYHIHLELRNTWGNSWSYMDNTINDSLNTETVHKCNQHLNVYMWQLSGSLPQNKSLSDTLKY